MLEDQLPWSYSSRAAELMHRSLSVVDLGTGGLLIITAVDWSGWLAFTDVAAIVYSLICTYQGKICTHQKHIGQSEELTME